jgi:phosphopantothenoylcysteine decarboxylase
MAPAMNTAMWQKPVVQRNVEQLKRDGVHIIGPEAGYLSCGMVGAGRMAEPEEIFHKIMEILQSVPLRQRGA